MMPFEGGVESPANATFIFSCAAALLYGTMAGAPPRLARSAVKTLAGRPGEVHGAVWLIALLSAVKFALV